MATAIEDKPAGTAKEAVEKVEQVPQPEAGAATKFLSRFVGSDVKVEAVKTADDEGTRETNLETLEEWGVKMPDDATDEQIIEKVKAGKPAPAAKPEKKPKKPAPVAPVAAPINPEDIATAAATGATRAFAEHIAKEKADKAEEPKIEFSPQETRRLAVLERMEKNKPEYKGTAARYKQSLADLLEYAEKWEKDHPGKEFIQDDDEHKEFFAKNEIPWDDDDYAEALADLRVDEKIGKTQNEINSKFAKIEKAERRSAATPEIRKTQVSSARTFYGQLGEQFKDLLQPNGTPNNDVLTKLQTEDPVSTNFAIQGADMVETYARATYELFNDLTDFNARNPVHSFLNNFILSNEKKLLEQPVIDQMDNKGRAFLPAAEYHKKMTTNAADTQRKYWTFERGDVDVLINHVILKHTRLQIKMANQQFETMAKARGIELPKKTAAKTADKPKTQPEKKTDVVDDDMDDKPRSPTAGFTAPPVVGDKTQTADTSPVGKFASKFLGR